MTPSSVLMTSLPVLQQNKKAKMADEAQPTNMFFNMK